jgi:hypothetical protein
MAHEKRGLDHYVMRCLSDFQPWTFWKIQQRINEKTGKFYGEPSISAAIRNIRKPYMRTKYGLPMTGEVVNRERIPNGKGYQYKLSHLVMNQWQSKSTARGEK